MTTTCGKQERCGLVVVTGLRAGTVGQEELDYLIESIFGHAMQWSVANGILLREISPGRNCLLRPLHGRLQRRLMKWPTYGLI